MFFEWINGEYRQPRLTGERAICRCCGAEVLAVVPKENQPHWRHKTRDCDPWSEPEGEWHLRWKNLFPAHTREIPMVNDVTGERHRADIYFQPSVPPGVTVELQHSPISESERLAREVFYMSRGRMFWLIHVHDENAFHGYSLSISLRFDQPFQHSGQTFYRMRWFGRSKQFIEKWKQSTAHVFFECGGSLFYLATSLACAEILKSQQRGDFALAPLSRERFIAAVLG